MAGCWGCPRSWESSLGFLNGKLWAEEAVRCGGGTVMLPSGGAAGRHPFTAARHSEVIAGVGMGTRSCSSALLLPQQGEDRCELVTCGSVSCKPPAFGKYWRETPSPGPKDEGET